MDRAGDGRAVSCQVDGNLLVDGVVCVSPGGGYGQAGNRPDWPEGRLRFQADLYHVSTSEFLSEHHAQWTADRHFRALDFPGDRKSTRLNSSHLGISYAVFCLQKKH